LLLKKRILNLFIEQFAFHTPSVINFVGGGGKTGLILTLLDEFAESTSPIYTTTTRMHPPDPGKGLVILSGDNMQLLKSVLNQIAGSYRSPHTKFVVANLPIPDSHNLIGGIPADFVHGLNRKYFSAILNEADGARSMSLKMPRAGEPVLMEEAAYLVPVIGIDCLLKPLGPETLFRWEMAAERYSLQAGQTITPKLAADLLLHKEGVCCGYRSGMSIVPFINKVDDPGQDSLARELALALLHNSHFPVSKVVWGSIFGCRANSLSAIAR
jgi:probable selenium-dependent hydroxylase accessory protein YqeC